MRPRGVIGTLVGMAFGYAARGVFAGIGLLPPGPRRRLAGMLYREFFGRLGMYARAETNLALVMPALSASGRHAIAAEALENFGMTMIEIFDPPTLARTAAAITPEGPGFAALRQAKAGGQAAMVISGHFGNWDVLRHVLKGAGMQTGAIFRPVSNPWLARYTTARVAAGGVPLFENDARGGRGAFRHLKDGGFLAVLLDQAPKRAPQYDFLGHPARTSRSVMALALRHNAVVIPAYAIRLDRGGTFRAVFEAPVPHTDADTMTRALLESLAARVRAHPGQWLWMHRRWK